MESKVKLIFQNAQQNASCHQKYLKSLESYYYKVPFEAFLEDLFKYLRHIFHLHIAVRNPYIERTLEFLAQFISFLTKPNENDAPIALDEDSPSHPFLTQVINETIRFHDLAYEQTRYYSCRLITLILQHIGNDTHLDNFICDCIQEAMLERIMDPKTPIRLQAIMALVRLQEPSNPECPVIKAYLSLLADSNPLIRKEVVKRVAPNSITISKISERIRDIDCHVRIAAYSRCADIGPQLFKIVTRQQILKCGFKDGNKHVKKVFLENLLPKWFGAYNDNFIAFLSGLKLDADENDIINTEEISKQVMEVLFGTVSIKDIIDALPIDNEKLIPLPNLSSEVVTYWSIVTRFLRNSGEMEVYLDNILSELTPFCLYIQRFIEFKTSKKLEEWEYLEYQYILYNLFDMAEQYDLSDEIGRKTFHELIMSVLQNNKLQFKLAKKMVGIAYKLFSNVDILAHEICQIISDIREPLVDKPAPQDEDTNRNFQIAELKVKVNILQGEIEDALDAQDFQKASIIQNEIVEYKRKLDDLEKQSLVVKVKVSKDDPETICRCLDLLSALMEVPSVTILSPSLATCKTEFLLPLLSSNIVEINWRVLKCIALYCLLDKNVAEEHAKILCIPIITYRSIPNYNKLALMQSVAAICDLMRIYGPKLFGNKEDSNNSTSTQHNTTKRKLYRNETMDDVAVLDHNRMNVEIIIEIILDMLDDENEDIRETAITAISKLILDDYPVSSTLISRIILKWFNPLEKAVDKTQQKLGSLITNYTKLVKGAREVIEKAVVPIISTIASAPRTSPLADVDIDNVLQFLAAITNSNNTMDIIHNHTNLAHTLCYKVASKPKDPTVPYLTKMLLYLEIPAESTVTFKELIIQAQLLLEEEEDGIDRGPRKNVRKFVEKLKLTLKTSTILEHTNQDTENYDRESNLGNDNRISTGTLQEKINNFLGEEKINVHICDINKKKHNNNDTNDKRHHNDKRATIKNNKGELDNTASMKNMPHKTQNTQFDFNQTASSQLEDNCPTLNVKDNNVNKKRYIAKRNCSRNLESEKIRKKLSSFRTLRNVKMKKKDNLTQGNLKANIKLKNNQIRNNNSRQKRKVSYVAETESGKNENKELQSAKRTRLGMPVKYGNNSNVTNNKEVYSKKLMCKNKNIDAMTDTETDTTTDIEENSHRTLRRSKRQKMSLNKSTDSEKENSKNEGKSNVKINNVISVNNISNIQTRRSNRNTRSSGRNTCSILRNYSSDKDSQDTNINGVKRKKLRGKQSQDSIRSEDTVLHTIIEHSHQICALESDTTFDSPLSNVSKRKLNMSSENSSYGINFNKSKTIISETSSESESASSSPIRRSLRKIKKKNMSEYVV